MKSTDELIDDLLTLAFAEDVGDGDHTTLSTIPADARGKQHLIVKEEGILAGVDIARRVFAKFDPDLKMTVFINDGAHVRPGDIAFEVEGSVRSLLQTERTMLNIMHEKEAVKIGGGMNHRIGLFDMILIKDNHTDFAGGIPQAVAAAKAYCKANGKDLRIEQEVRNTEEILQAIEAGVDRIMLDNYTPEQTVEAVRLIREKAPHIEIESSGGITIDTLRAYGEAGVDFISVGALTHSVKGLDMSFKAC